MDWKTFGFRGRVARGDAKPKQLTRTWDAELVVLVQRQIREHWRCFESSREGRTTSRDTSREMSAQTASAGTEPPQSYPSRAKNQ